MDQSIISENWDLYKKWRSHNEPTESETDSFDLYGHHPLISSAMITANMLISVVDLKSMMYRYLSPNYFDFLGWTKEEVQSGGVRFAFDRVSPDDQNGVIKFSSIIANYFKGLPDDSRTYYRAFWDYRVMNNDGKYLRILQQDRALKYDQDGNIHELFVVGSKITNVIPDNSQHLRLTNGQQDLFYKYDHSAQAIVQLELPTEREMEVVKLIAKSFALKQIAEKLSISFNTVKVHSTNIMRKLQVNDSLEMVTLLRVWGFI